MQVPFTVKPPADAGYAPGREVDRPVSLLDLAPTVLASAGITVPERQDGMDLTPYLKGENPPRPADKPILSEIWSHVMPNPAVALQFVGPGGAPFMYTYNAADAKDELYDVDASSVELENLIDAASSAGSSRRISLRRLPGSSSSSGLVVSKPWRRRVCSRDSFTCS